MEVLVVRRHNEDVCSELGPDVYVYIYIYMCVWVARVCVFSDLFDRTLYSSLHRACVSYSVAKLQMAS